MALLFMDGFDHYDDDELAYKWDSAYYALPYSSYYTIEQTTPRRAGSSYLKLESGGRWIQKNIAFGDNTAIIGFAFYRPNPNANFTYFINTNQFTLVLNTDGSFSFYEGAYNGVLLGTSAVGLVSPNVWYYIELKVVVDNSAGSFEVRLNGTNVLSDSGVDTQDDATSVISYVILGKNGTFGDDVYFDDLYVCDGTGSSHNDFLGDCKVDTVFPSAAGNYSQWTPSGEASNYLCVDETVPNDDTDYVTTNISGEIDTYNFGNLVDYSGETIHAVALNTCKKKDDVGFISSYPVIRIGASDYSGELMNTYESYHYQQEVWETNPDDSQAWEGEDVNSGEFGIKMQED